MQFPVPQFTDVEDKIIGSLTIKQFGIIFAVGIILFLGYSATKSIAVVIFMFLIFGVPALGLALVPFNGRPMYNFIGKLIAFVFSPKQLIFHKEVHSLVSTTNLNNVEAKKPETETKASLVSEDKIKQLEQILNKTSAQEKEIAGKIRN